MIIGMDFGTTNSGMATYDGRSIQVLPLDPTNANPRVLRTAIYITNEQAVHIGRDAVDRYYAQNIGRVVKTRKVWIGEIEVYAEDMYYVTDAYAWVDVSEPGRLMLSIKSRLREEDHPGAIVGQHFYPLEDLIALYMTVAKTRAEKLLGQELKQVVLGRPVHFSNDEAHDRLAQGRLLQAAFRAGYEQVYFQFEPIAAAFGYETTLDAPQNVLVFDFGGGTLDITVMRLGDPGKRAVLATGGIPIAGDIFDQKLTRAKLPKHFGEGSFYGPRHKAMSMPKWIFDAFSSWQTIIELQTTENKRVLEDIARTAQRRYQIEALLSLVSSNYGLKMFDEVEKAKRILSDKYGSQIRLDGPDFKVREFVTRTEFERVIRSDFMTIEAELLRTVAASGLEATEIDAVIRTGGSAQIPMFYELLCHQFGAEKVRSLDAFSSVTAGLGVIAHGIETGEIEAHAYTPNDVLPPPEARGSRPQITPVNLTLMQKRIIMDEGLDGAHQQAESQQKVLVGLGPGLTPTAVSTPTELWQQTDPISLVDLGINTPINYPLLVDPDDQILIVTSTYRFLLIGARQLLDLHAMGLGLPDLHKLEKRETLCTLASWSQLRTTTKMVIVTTRGYMRAYPLNVMISNIEAPIPLRFDHPLPGLPLGVWGVEEGTEFILVSQERRGWRWPLANVRSAGSQAANCGKTDGITAVAPITDTELTILTADGYGRRSQPAWVPEPPKPNAHGKVLVTRRSPLAAIGTGSFWVLTNQRLVWIENGRLPLSKSTKTKPAFKLKENEAVVGILPI